MSFHVQLNMTCAKFIFLYLPFYFIEILRCINLLRRIQEVGNQALILFHYNRFRILEDMITCCYINRYYFR